MSNRFLLCVAVCLIFFFTDPFPAAAAKLNTAGWDIIDRTGAIELSSVIDESEGVFTVFLKNRSADVITAVALSFRDGAHYYQDWLNAEPPGLPPGQTFDVTISAEDAAKQNVRISAVLFEDGSGKGDPDQLEIMNFHRFGQILESTRIRDILRNRQSSQDDASMDVLERTIGKMPHSADEALESLTGVSVPGIRLAPLKQYSEKTRTALLWGISTTRERALRQMDKLKQLPVVSTEEKVPSRAAVLSFLQEQYELQNKKAAALLARMQGGH